MTRGEFQKQVETVWAKNPRWFGLEADPAASESDVGAAERELGIDFPMAYRHFLLDYGGGYFGLSNVYSVAPTEWNVVLRNREQGLIRDLSFLTISEDGTGAFYGFSVQDGRCRDPISYCVPEEKTVESTGHSDLYEYLAMVALTS